MATGSSDKDEPVVITDKRKIDRQTAKKPDDQVASPPERGGEVPAPDENATLLAERTADLQRLQAEYANYRRRAERERQAAGSRAKGELLATLLPVLDDVDRAEQHGDLQGPLGAIAEKLRRTVTMAGLERVGYEGEPFDPSIHEAVLHDESDDVTEPTCTTVMRPGYKHNDRLLRAAMVGVSDPATQLQEPEPDESADADSE